MAVTLLPLCCRLAFPVALNLHFYGNEPKQSKRVHTFVPIAAEILVIVWVNALALSCSRGARFFPGHRLKLDNFDAVAEAEAEAAAGNTSDSL